MREVAARRPPTARRWTSLAWLGLVERKDPLPVLLHVDDGPALRLRLLERLVELADRRRMVVGPFALGVGVVHEQREARARAGGRPLEHLLVAVGVAERHQRPPADQL